jgi:hypothetical protein
MSRFFKIAVCPRVTCLCSFKNKTHHRVTTGKIVVWQSRNSFAFIPPLTQQSSERSIMMSFRHYSVAIMMMIIALLLLVCGTTTTVHGFQSPRMVVQQETSSTRRMMTVLGSEISSRQAFLANSATAAAVAIGAGSALVIMPPAPAQADEYDDARAAKRAQDAESKGASTLAVPLIGGLLLSLPFFLPNILRLLGVKNSKMKD